MTSIQFIINRLRIGNGLRQLLNFGAVAGVAFVQLDDLKAQKQIDRVRPPPLSSMKQAPEAARHG